MSNPNVPDRKSAANSNSLCSDTFIEREKLGTSSFKGTDGDDVLYLEGHEILAEAEANKYESSFNIKYFFFAPKAVATGWLEETPSLDTITVSDLGTIPPDDVIAFVKRTYYDRFSLHQTEKDFQQFKDTVPHYLGTANIVRGKAYIKDKQIIALLMTHVYESHPALKRPTVHIGYWGYDRESVTAEEARAVKADWFVTLAGYAKSADGVDASVDHFNPAAAKLVQSRGFTIEAIRLDRRKK